MTPRRFPKLTDGFLSKHGRALYTITTAHCPKQATPNPAFRGYVPVTTMTDHADAGDVKSTSLNSSVSSIGRTPPPALKMGSPSPHSSHRSSFVEHMRGTPTSPRTSRQPSLTQQALQDLLNNPPTKGGDAKFQGRDWKTVRLGEIVDPELVRFVEYDTSVEEATNVSTLSLYL